MIWCFMYEASSSCYLSTYESIEPQFRDKKGPEPCVLCLRRLTVARCYTYWKLKLRISHFTADFHLRINYSNVCGFPTSVTSRVASPRGLLGGHGCRNIREEQNAPGVAVDHYWHENMNLNIMYIGPCIIVIVGE